MEVERLVRTLPPGQEDTPKFSDSHPQVSTPEYTPLIIRNRGIQPASTTVQPRSAEGKTTKKALKSVGICAALPMRRVRFFVSLCMCNDSIGKCSAKYTHLMAAPVTGIA